LDLRLERRLAPRRNTSIEAVIAYRGGAPLRRCIIRNVSETGAKLEVAPVAGIPDLFDLLVAGHRPQPCKIVWRALKEIGVQYLPA